MGVRVEGEDMLFRHICMRRTFDLQNDDKITLQQLKSSL